MWGLGDDRREDVGADAATALEAYRSDRDGVRRAHLQVIWLLLSGEAASAVARVKGSACAGWKSWWRDGTPRGRPGWPIDGAAMALPRCWMRRVWPLWRRRWSKSPRTAGYGAAARWRGGCRSNWGGRSIPSLGWIISTG